MLREGTLQGRKLGPRQWHIPAVAIKQFVDEVLSKPAAARDGDGLCLFAKRLGRGRFVWPQADKGAVSLSSVSGADGVCESILKSRLELWHHIGTGVIRIREQRFRVRLRVRVRVRIRRG
jgi:hypothetical protein